MATQVLGWASDNEDSLGAEADQQVGDFTTFQVLLLCEWKRLGLTLRVPLSLGSRMQLGTLTVVGHSSALPHPLFNGMCRPCSVFLELSCTRQARLEVSPICTGANVIGRRVDEQDKARECPEVGADFWKGTFLKVLNVSPQVLRHRN